MMFDSSNYTNNCQHPTSGTNNFTCTESSNSANFHVVDSSVDTTINNTNNTNHTTAIVVALQQHQVPQEEPWKLETESKLAVNQNIILPLLQITDTTNTTTTIGSVNKSIICSKTTTNSSIGHIDQNNFRVVATFDSDSSSNNDHNNNDDATTMKVRQKFQPKEQLILHKESASTINTTTVDEGCSATKEQQIEISPSLSSSFPTGCITTRNNNVPSVMVIPRKQDVLLFVPSPMNGKPTATRIEQNQQQQHELQKQNTFLMTRTRYATWPGNIRFQQLVNEYLYGNFWKQSTSSNSSSSKKRKHSVPVSTMSTIGTPTKRKFVALMLVEEIGSKSNNGGGRFLRNRVCDCHRSCKSKSYIDQGSTCTNTKNIDNQTNISIASVKVNYTTMTTTAEYCSCGCHYWSIIDSSTVVHMIENELYHLHNHTVLCCENYNKQQEPSSSKQQLQQKSTKFDRHRKKARRKTKAPAKKKRKLITTRATATRSAGAVTTTVTTTATTTTTTITINNDNKQSQTSKQQRRSKKSWSMKSVIPDDILLLYETVKLRAQQSSSSCVVPSIPGNQHRTHQQQEQEVVRKHLIENTTSSKSSSLAAAGVTTNMDDEHNKNDVRVQIQFNNRRYDRPCTSLVATLPAKPCNHTATKVVHKRKQDILLTLKTKTSSTSNSISSKNQKYCFRKFLEWPGNVYFQKVLDKYFGTVELYKDKLNYVNEHSGTTTSSSTSTNNNNNNNGSSLLLPSEAQILSYIDSSATVTTTAPKSTNSNVTDVALTVLTEMFRVGGRFLLLQKSNQGDNVDFDSIVEQWEEIELDKRILDMVVAALIKMMTKQQQHETCNRSATTVTTTIDPMIPHLGTVYYQVSQQQHQQQMSQRRYNDDHQENIVRIPSSHSSTFTVPEPINHIDCNDPPSIQFENPSYNRILPHSNNDNDGEQQQFAHEATLLSSSSSSLVTKQRTDPYNDIHHSSTIIANYHSNPTTEMMYLGEDSHHRLLPLLPVPPVPIPIIPFQSPELIQKQTELNEVCARIQINDPAVTCADIDHMFTTDMISILGHTLYQTLYEDRMQQYVKAMGLEISNFQQNLLPNDSTTSSSDYNDNNSTNNNGSDNTITSSSGGGGPYKALFLYLEHSPVLHTVFVNGYNESTVPVAEHFMDSLSKSMSIRYLILCNMSFSLSTFQTLIETNHSIELLELEGCHFVAYKDMKDADDDTDNQHHSTSAIGTLKRMNNNTNHTLKQITLKGEMSLRDSFVIPVLQHLQCTCTCLEKISLKNGDNNSDNTTATTLLSSSIVSAHAWNALANLILYCPTVIHLSFSSWNFIGTDLQILANAIRQRHVVVSNNSGFQVTIAASCRADGIATNTIVSMFNALDDEPASSAVACAPTNTTTRSTSSAAGCGGRGGATILHIGNGCKFSKPITTLIHTIACHPQTSLQELRLRSMAIGSLETFLKKTIIHSNNGFHKNNLLLSNNNNNNKTALRKLDLGTICSTDIRRVRILLWLLPNFPYLRELTLHVGGTNGSTSSSYDDYGNYGNVTNNNNNNNNNWFINKNTFEQIKKEFINAFQKNTSLFYVHFITYDPNKEYDDDDDEYVPNDEEEIVPTRSRTDVSSSLSLCTGGGCMEWTQQEATTIQYYWDRNRFCSNEKYMVSQPLSLFPYIAATCISSFVTEEEKDEEDDDENVKTKGASRKGGGSKHYHHRQHYDCESILFRGILSMGDFDEFHVPSTSTTTSSNNDDADSDHHQLLHQKTNVVLRRSNRTGASMTHTGTPTNNDKQLYESSSSLCNNYDDESTRRMIRRKRRKT